MSDRRAILTIDLDAIYSNIALLAGRNPDSRVLVVVKADSYGLGAVPISKYLEEQDRDGIIEGFAVATLEEGIALRDEGISRPIFMLSVSFPEEYKRLIEYDICPTITCLEDALELSGVAVKMDKKVYVDVKIDTGMGRIGFPATRESVDKILDIFKLPGLLPGGIFTHFPCADMKDNTSTILSHERFVDMEEALRTRGVEFKYIHCQNSAASLVLGARETNLLRAGVIIYGVNPLEDDRFARDIRDVVSFKSHIIFLKEVLPDTPIGYGGTFVTDNISVIATVPVGYADGIPRDASNRGYVLIRGKRAPIVGRVCMDQFMVDVTDIPGVSRYDEVTILGTDMDERISLDDMSAMSGRFPYELLTCLGKRVKREYKKK